MFADACACMCVCVLHFRGCQVRLLAVVVLNYNKVTVDHIDVKCIIFSRLNPKLLMLKAQRLEKITSPQIPAALFLLQLSQVKPAFNNSLLGCFKRKHIIK